MRPNSTQAESYDATEPYLRAGRRRGQEGLRLRHSLFAARDDRLRRRAPGFSAAARGGRGAPRQLPQAAKLARASPTLPGRLAAGLSAWQRGASHRQLPQEWAPSAGAGVGQATPSGQHGGPGNSHITCALRSLHNAFGSRVLAGAAKTRLGLGCWRVLALYLSLCPQGRGRAAPRGQRVSGPGDNLGPAFSAAGAAGAARHLRAEARPDRGALDVRRVRCRWRARVRARPQRAPTAVLARHHRVHRGHRGLHRGREL
jgi:hypothetical protein